MQIVRRTLDGIKARRVGSIRSIERFDQLDDRIAQTLTSPFFESGSWPVNKWNMKLPTTPSQWDRALVLFAVQEEARPFSGAKGEANSGITRPKGATAWDPVRVVVTGMGAANAEREFLTVLARAERMPEFVLTCGFAGALVPQFPTGAVVFDSDPDFFLDNRFLTAGASRVSFHCAPRIAITRAEKLELRKTTGADVVEMESGIIREIARARGIPAATVRVISDASGEDLPLDFNALMNSRMELNFGRLAGKLVRSPGKIPDLIRFGAQTKRAAIRLAEVIAAVLQ